MTGKEFLEKKIKENIESLGGTDYRITFSSYIPAFSEKTYRINFTDDHSYYDYVYFDLTKGVDFDDYESRQKKSPKDEKTVTTTRNFCRRINEVTAMLRFYYSKNFNIKDLREIFSLSKEEAPSGVTKKPDVSEVEGYPDEVTGKGAVRVKIKQGSSYNRFLYKIVTLGKPSKDGKHFTINAPSQIAVQHSAELTFLKKEDAEKFIADNNEFFSKYDKKDIEFVKAQTHNYVRVPVMNSTVTYVEKDYLRWRDREGKFSPKFS